MKQQRDNAKKSAAMSGEKCKQRKADEAAGKEARDLAVNAIGILDENEKPAVVLLTKLGAAPPLVKEARKLLGTKGVGFNGLSRAAYKGLELHNTSFSSFDEYDKAYCVVRSHMVDAVEAVDDRYVGRANFGNGLDIKTRLGVPKHYAPMSCLHYEGGHADKIDPANPCIQQFLHVLPRSLFKEYFPDSVWNQDLRNQVSESVAIMDMIYIIPDAKSEGVTSSEAAKDVKKEWDQFAKDAGVSVERRDLISFLQIAMHAKGHRIAHAKPLKVMFATKEGHKTLTNLIAPMRNDEVDILPRSPHGEVYAARHIKNMIQFPDIVLSEISSTLKDAYYDILGIQYSEVAVQESSIAERFAGIKSRHDRGGEAKPIGSGPRCLPQRWRNDG